MNQNAINELKEIIQKVINSGGVVSDIKYIGMGAYKGITNSKFEITFDEIAKICRILDLTLPTQGIWDSELDRIHGGYGCHSHSFLPYKSR
ncbi:hypothetical protein [Arsenophonus sp.]|uniref:hypothetical protein n=1 Tax=Arsenophonus sp. TaxID=1872640 RepID=UPI0038796826